MKRIVVTGADGFIGTELVSSLKNKKLSVITYNHKIHSLQKISTLEKLVKGCDTVYHLAGLTNSNDPNLFQVNLLGTLNLLEAMQQSAPQAKLIFASSFSVYSPPNKHVLLNENSLISPRNNYGLSKLLAEKAIVNYPDLKTKPLILRLSNVYGSGMRANAHSVVANFFSAITKQEKITLNNKGRDTRDFIYIDDVVSAFILADQKNISGTYNICSGEEISILDLSERIGKITNKKVFVNKTKIGNPSFWQGDYSKAKKDFGWKPNILFNEGLEKIWQTKK